MHSGQIIPHITVDGIKVYNRKSTANEFGKFYANLGGNLASKIQDSTMTPEHYLTQIPRTLNSLVLAETLATEIQKIIDRLPNKTSSGHDSISNVLLKEIRSAITYPLQIIFNQSIVSGVFPNLMKIAKIIPLYKGKEEDLLVNYRPVLLLMMMSKVLEKIIYQWLYNFLSKNNIFYESQYGFRMKHSCEHANMEMIGHLLQAKNDSLHSTGIFLDL